MKIALLGLLVAALLVAGVLGVSFAFAPPNTCIHIAITSPDSISVMELTNIGKQAMQEMAQETLRVTAYESNENSLPTISIVFPAASPKVGQVQQVVEAILTQRKIAYYKVAVWDHPLPTN